MYTYSFIQWLLFFYIYCFFGWCFESTYVSIRTKEIVNRGFLAGPYLPIYGSGAICVLFAALPFRNSPVEVYFVGLFAATALELVTGIVMESLFKVRYWDYTPKKFNYKGHICLSSSIAWGAFSVAMVYGFHKPVEQFVLLLPEWVVRYGTFVITVIFAGDFAISFKTAMELRDVLIAAAKVKNELRLMKKRAEVIEAFMADEAEQRKEAFAENAAKMQAELKEIRTKEQLRIENLKQKLTLGADKIALLRRNPSAHLSEDSAMFESIKHGFLHLKKGVMKTDELREKVLEELLIKILETEQSLKTEVGEKVQRVKQVITSQKEG